MGAPTQMEKEKANWMPDPGRRRSMRVLLSVPIRVIGKTAENKEFAEDTRTLVVNAHGALISLSAKVVSGQTVAVANNATQQSLECRVVHIGSTQAGRAQLGVEFAKPSPKFWQIDFPPDDWVVPED